MGQLISTPFSKPTQNTSKIIMKAIATILSVLALGSFTLNAAEGDAPKKPKMDPAKAFASNNNMDDAEVARCYAAKLENADGADSLNWEALEWFAMERAFDGWGEMPENVSLVWQ